MRDVLRKRAEELGRPIPMCDALSGNQPQALETIEANCLAHGRPLAAGPALTRILFIVAALLAPKCVRPMHDVYFPIVEAAQWVKQHAQPGDAVLATSPYVRFYAGVDGLVLGPEVATLESGMASAPSEHGWRFLTLEVDRRTFTAHALRSGSTEYHEIAEIGGHPTRPWYKVLVFEPVAHGDAQTASRGAGRH